MAIADLPPLIKLGALRRAAEPCPRERRRGVELELEHRLRLLAEGEGLSVDPRRFAHTWTLDGRELRSAGWAPRPRTAPEESRA